MSDEISVLERFFGPRRAGEIVAERERAAAGAARRHALKAEYEKKGSEYEGPAAREVADAARRLEVADRAAQEAQLAVHLAAQAKTGADLHRSGLQQRRQEIAAELLASADPQLIALRDACIRRNMGEPHPTLRQVIEDLETLSLQPELPPGALDELRVKLRAAGVVVEAA